MDNIEKELINKMLQGKEYLKNGKIYDRSYEFVKYVLDKNKKNNDYAQAGLDDELPEVDAIIVTPKYYQDEIMEKLKAKTKNRLLRYEEWEKLVWK